MTTPHTPPLIFVVDDVIHNRDMYVEYLRFIGYAAIGCMNGEELFEKLGTMRPDLIILDLSMPIMDGWQTTRRLKENPSTKSIPVIVLTAHSLDSAREMAIAAGADVYLVKPYLPSDLATKISEVLTTTPI